MMAKVKSELHRHRPIRPGKAKGKKRGAALTAKTASEEIERNAETETRLLQPDLVACEQKGNEFMEEMLEAVERESGSQGDVASGTVTDSQGVVITSPLSIIFDAIDASMPALSGSSSAIQA